MKKLFKLFICFMLLLMVSFPVKAQRIDHFKGVIDESASTEDEINGSVALIGSNAFMRGTSDGVSFMAANSAEFSGESEYALIVGNSVMINGVINKDAFIAGNVITIDESAKLKRDVIIVGADVLVQGVIDRNISIYASNVSFKGANIEGNVKVYASFVSARDTKINGNLSYPENATSDIEDDTVLGNTSLSEVIEEEDNFVTTIMGHFWSFMSLILVFAVLSLMAPKLFTKIQNAYDEFSFNKGLDAFTKGILFLILMPIIIVILFLMSIGIPLALILLALYFILIYLSSVFTGYLLGYKLWDKFFKSDINMLVVGILGLAILFVLNMIPVISVIVSMLSTLIGIGIIYDIVLKQIGSNE